MGKNKDGLSKADAKAIAATHRMSKEDAAAQDQEDANLLAAALTGVVKEVEKCLTEDLDGDGLGADVNAKAPGDDGMSSLMVACEKGFKDVAALLIKYGASVDARSGFNKPVNRKDPRTGRWRTALHFAAEGGHASCVSLLLENAANPHMPDNEGATPAMVATGEALKVLLMAHKVEVYHMCATDGYVDALELLLNDEGFATDLPESDEYDSTKMHMLRASGENQKHVDALIAAVPPPPAVSVAATNGWGENALHFACGGGETGAVEFLLPIIREKEPKAVEAITKCGETPLMFAAMKGHVAPAQMLLESDELFARWEGVQVDTKNEFGYSALVLAAKYGHMNMVRLLVEFKASIETKNVDGFTALILACEAGHTTMAKMLKEKGANLEETTEWGKSAMDYAKDHDHKEILAILNGEEGVEVKKGGKR